MRPVCSDGKEVEHVQDGINEGNALVLSVVGMIVPVLR